MKCFLIFVCSLLYHCFLSRGLKHIKRENYLQKNHKLSTVKVFICLSIDENRFFPSSCRRDWSPQQGTHVMSKFSTPDHTGAAVSHQSSYQLVSLTELSVKVVVSYAKWKMTYYLLPLGGSGGCRNLLCSQQQRPEDFYHHSDHHHHPP